MIIHTILCTGQNLDKKFQEAISLNGYDLVYEKSDSGITDHDEILYSAWKKIFDKFSGDIFIALENRLIIEKGCVEDMVKELSDCDIILYSTLSGQFNFEYPNDAFFATKAEVLKKIPFFYEKGKCPLCEWLKRASKSFTMKYLGDKRLELAY